MRRTLQVVAGVLAALSLQSQAWAGTLSNVQIDGGPVHRPSEANVAVYGAADFTGDSTDALQVFTDATGGDGLGRGTPPQTDLVAGSIQEVGTGLTGRLEFTWKVAAIAPVLPGMQYYYWEFTLAGLPFQVVAWIDEFGEAYGNLNGDCEVTGTLIDCPLVSEDVQARFSEQDNTITASLKRSLFKNDQGQFIARDGAVLREAELWNGISSYLSAPLGLLISGATRDQASMESAWILGQHVQATIAPANTPDDELVLLFGDTAVGVPGSGLQPFSMTLPIGTLTAGDYVVALRACTGGRCPDQVTKLPLTIEADPSP